MYDGWVNLGHKGGDIEEGKEVKAMVIAAVWGTEFIQFLAAQATVFCTRTILKNWINSYFSSNHPGAIQRILQMS